MPTQWASKHILLSIMLIDKNILDRVLSSNRMNSNFESNYIDPTPDAIIWAIRTGSGILLLVEVNLIIFLAS